MTINSIIDGISVALDKEFNAESEKYTIRANELKQGLREPCFFISCINHTCMQFFGNRYFRENGFCIQYFPESKDRAAEECNDVSERLFAALGFITIASGLIKGTKMHGEFVDGILHFFVNYDMFVYADKEAQPSMETLDTDTAVKG